MSKPGVVSNWPPRLLLEEHKVRVRRKQARPRVANMDNRDRREFAVLYVCNRGPKIVGVPQSWHSDRHELRAPCRPCHSEHVLAAMEPHPGLRRHAANRIVLSVSSQLASGVTRAEDSSASPRSGRPQCERGGTSERSRPAGWCWRLLEPIPELV